MESRPDRRACPGRRLRHQCRPHEGRACREPAALARDGLHRYVRDGGRRRDPADLYALRRARPGCRSNVQAIPGPGLQGQGGYGLAGDVDGPDPGFGCGGDAEAGHGGPVRCARQTR